MNDHLPHDMPDDEEIELVSKTQLKREAHAFVDIGIELVALNAAKLVTVPLPDHIQEAINTAQKIKSNAALKRQRLYIGKQLRRLSEDEITPITEALERINNEALRQNSKFKQLERWRDRLITEGDNALGDLLAEYPAADRQQLRQLIRNAQREKKQEKPPKSAREIFKLLRDLAG